jgi:hypothetical protein
MTSLTPSCQPLLVLLLFLVRLVDETLPPARLTCFVLVGRGQEAIKIGGLAATKVSRIRAILETVLEERPHLCAGGEGPPILSYKVL